MAVALSTFAETQKPVETPIIETPAVETPTPETPVIETPTPETPITETPQEDNISNFSFGAEIIETPTTETPAATPAVFNFDEEIKKIDRKELLKKVGVNDFAIEIDEHLSKGGNAIDYLNAKSIDYNKVSDETIVKSDLQKQYPTFTSQQIDLMFNRKYAVAEDALEGDKEFAELQLKADAHNSRQAKITEQQKFKIPDTPILHTDEAYEQWKQEQQSQPQLIEKVKNYFLNHEATKILNESKRVTVTLGEGVAPFNFNVDKPEMITRNLTDGGEMWGKLTSTKTGEPDVPKQQLITLFAANPQKFMQDIFNYGLSTGQRKLVTEGQNATKPTTPVHSITGEKATYSTGTYGGGKQ